MKELLCLCILCGSQLAFSADVFIGNQPRPFTVGDKLEIDATIGGYPIWQGENKWRMLAILRSDSTGTAASIPLGQLRVFQAEDKKLVSVLQVSGNLTGGSSSDWTDEPCKREDLLFKSSIGGKFQNVNCVTINHYTGFLSNPDASWATLYALLKEQDIEVPPTVLRFSFTRYSSNSRRLVVTLTINPELAGFSRETESWGRNAWHKSQAFNDPAKKKFIDALGVWALQFAKQMDVAFDKQKDAFSNINSWRSVIVDNSKPANPATTITTAATQAPLKPESLEEKLKELKRLYDAGLITNDVYLDRQRKALEAI